MVKKKKYLVLTFLFFAGVIFANEKPNAACPTIAMSGTDVACYGQSNGSAQVAISNGSGNYTITWSNGTNVNSIVGLSVGTYTVNVKDNVSGCTVVGAFVVGSPDPISITESITDINCFGINSGEIQITTIGGTAGYTYSWLNSSSVQVSTSEDLLNVVSGSYTVNITDTKSCTFSKVFNISQPIESLNSSVVIKNVDCYSAATGEIDVNVWGGTPPYAYLWSSGQLTQDVSGLTQGSYTLTVTDAKGCSIVLPYNITQPDDLGGSISSSPVLCYGDATGSVSFSPVDGTAPYSYVWQNSTTLYSSNVNVLNNVIADTYQVTVTDAKGCTFISSVDVNQPFEMTTSQTFSNVSCNGGNDGSIDLTVLGGSPTYSYQWTNSNGDNVSTSQDLMNVVAETYTVVVTDSKGCTKSLTQKISQPLLPINVQTVVKDVLCFGENTGSIDLSIIGGTSPYVVSWTSSQVTEDIANIFTGTYGYTVFDAKGCTFVGSEYVSEPAQPLMVSNTITDVLCFGEANGNIDLTVTGGTIPYTYAWSNSSYLLSEIGEDINDFLADSYTFDITDDNGCKYIDTLEIMEPPVLTTNVVGVDVLCKFGNNGSVDLTVNGGVLPYSYLWSNGLLTEDIATLTAGSYSVTVTDSNNCTIKDSIVLIEPMDSISYSFTVKDVTCNDGTNGEINLTIDGGTLPYSYSWSTGDTTSYATDLTAGYFIFTVTDDHACVLSDSIFINQPAPLTLSEIITPVTCYGLSDGEINISPVGGTAPYNFTWFNSTFALSAQTEDLIGFPLDTYQLEVLDSNNCFYEIFFEIEQPDSIIIEYVFEVVSCQGGDNGGIDVTVTGGNTGPNTYEWSNGASTEDVFNLAAGVYEMIYTDAKGCSDSISVEVVEPDTISITFDHVEISCADQEDGIAYAFPVGGNGGFTFLWSDGVIENMNTELSNEWYSVVVTDLLGCTAEDSVFITKNDIDCVRPVNTFTPNGDDYNDTWVIDNLHLYPEMDLQIFNRWGNIIHTQKGEYKAWEGTDNGSKLPSDTYYYVLVLGPNNEPITGNITIVR